MVQEDHHSHHHEPQTQLVQQPTTVPYPDICHQPHNVSNITDISIGSSNHSSLVTDDHLNRSDSGFESSTTATAAVTLSSVVSINDATHRQSPISPFERTITSPLAATADEATAPDQTEEYHQPSAVERLQTAVEQDIAEKSFAPDISGLELLSNSIEAFEKHIFIKQEPQDKHEPASELRKIEPELVTQMAPPPPAPINIDETKNFHTSAPIVEPVLGGLNLLCALAEQRFHEEVSQVRGRKRSSSSEGSDSKKLKKHHKDKSSRKSGKKSRKDRKDRKNRHQQQQHQSDDDELVKADLTETFNRVKASYGQCVCKTNGDADEAAAVKCCRDRCNWPTAEEMYIAMDTDMRNRLAKMAKEVQEEKRKLHEIKATHSVVPQPPINSDWDSLPVSASNSYYCVMNENASPSSTVKALSEQNVAEHLHHQQQQQQPNGGDPYRFDDADTNSSASSKRHQTAAPEDDSTAVKKNKSLVGYIFATKKRLNDSKNDNSTSTTTSAATTTDETNGLPSFAGVATATPSAFIKQELVDSNENACDQGLFGNIQAAKRMHKSKHTSKHKKSKSRERKHRRSTEVRERKRRIDARCMLTGDHLDGLTDKSSSRVLTAMGGLFYAGCLSAIQPPDVYAVTLDGERGNRPHIMSREEILRDAVSRI